MTVSPIREITLLVRVPEENIAEAVDALNETLNSLARDDVINDDFDNAWEWKGVPR